MNLIVSVTGNPSQANFPCSSLSFTMHLEPGPGGLGATLGHNGWVTSGGQLVQGDKGTYELAGPVALRVGLECSALALKMTRLSLRASDTDGDQVVDGISGSGIGTASVLFGDVGVNVSLSFELSGSPDVTPPELISPGTMHPLNVVYLAASEPLALTSQLTLEGTSTVSLDGWNIADGAFGSFSSDVILPFSGSWIVAGSAEDLVGLAKGPGPTLTSLADPGVFVADGFEGATLAAVMTGDARLVSGVGTLPALSGSHSLLVEPGSSVTLHLARPVGASSVRFISRSLAPQVPNAGPPSFFEGPPVELGVIGGVDRPNSVSSSAGDSVAIGDPTWAYAGPLQDVTVPLRETGSDIVLRILPRTQDSCSVFLCPPPPAVLIDDLRVE